MVTNEIKKSVDEAIQFISKAQRSLDSCRLTLQTIVTLCQYSDSVIQPLSLNFDVADKINSAILDLYSAFHFVKDNRDALKGEDDAKD